jgi:hypothetical protein
LRSPGGEDLGVPVGYLALILAVLPEPIAIQALVLIAK